MYLLALITDGKFLSQEISSRDSVSTGLGFAIHVAQAVPSYHAGSSPSSLSVPGTAQPYMAFERASALSD